MAPAAPEPPAPPPAPVVLDTAHVGRLWPGVLNQLKAEHPPIHAFVEHATVVDVAADVVTLGVGNEFGAKMLARPEHREPLEAQLGRTLGQRVRVEVRTVAAAAPPPPAAAPAGAPAGSPGAPDLDALRQAIISTFDATEE
ncbi:MAG: hypothetical protein U0Y82_00420 [Thermoleophilia bacterium]